MRGMYRLTTRELRWYARDIEIQQQPQRDKREAYAH
jgi:hypothetical protein